MWVWEAVRFLPPSNKSNQKNIKKTKADAVIDITFVDSDGGVHTVTRGSLQGRAIVGGLGLLGVVTELTLQLTPETHTRLETQPLLPDTNFAADVLAHVKVYECCCCLLFLCVLCVRVCMCALLRTPSLHSPQTNTRNTTLQHPKTNNQPHSASRTRSSSGAPTWGSSRRTL